MSKITTITSAAGAQNLRAEYASRSLEIKVRSTHGTTLQAFDGFLTSIAGVELEVNKQTKNGSTTVLQRTNLLDLFELAQANGGLIRGDRTGLTNAVESAVELSDYGSIPLLDGEFLEINFFNFPAAAGYTFEIDVYSVDAMELSNIHNVYEKHYFNASSPREIDVRSAKLVAIPQASLSKLELLYGNGRRVQYTKEEVLALMRDGLELRGYVNDTDGVSSINGFNRMALFNVAHAAIAKITTVDGTNVIVLKHQEM